ncbi:hypothetical protein [Bradyrhizobium sp. JR3.12]|uniref:hypothetical protein n=1 Tax=Bradyrhizobium sp. JR3.12 TaxID=3156371 RepID=UPI00339974B6
MIRCRVHGCFRGRLYAGAPHDGVQKAWHLDVKSAVRKARREIAHTFVPAGTLVPPKADPGWFKTGSCGAHLWLEFGAVGPDSMEDDSHFASHGNLGLFGADAFGQLAAPALERRTSPDNGQQDFAASNR